MRHQYTIGKVTLAGISGFTRLAPFQLVNFLQPLQKSKTHRRNLPVMYPHISCNVLTDTEDGNQESVSPQKHCQLNKTVLITATISRYLCLNILKLRNDEMASCLKKTWDWATYIHKSVALLHSCSSMDKAQYCVSSNLTHWDQDNLTAILQTTFSNSFLLYGNCILLFKLAVI